VQAKAKAFDDYHATHEYLKEHLELDLWMAAFFWKMKPENGEMGAGIRETGDLDILAPTQGELIRLRNRGELDARLVERVKELAERLKLFHWELAFPKVFAGNNPGFDCVLGNPPWERIKLQEEEFFAQRDPEIANAQNKAARQKLIDALSHSNPALTRTFEDAKHAAEAKSKFVRQSGRFPLTAMGDVNTYALFAEHFRSLISSNGRMGMIVPTGIATDDTTKQFFGDLVEKRAIASLFDFENREKLFPEVDSRMKFCLLTISGSQVAKSEFIFFATRIEHLRDPQRRFSLAAQEIALFNPNTHTMPVFRTRADAELTRKIYKSIPVLINEPLAGNPWGISFAVMFHMSNDSGLFISEPREGYLPLYEAKLMWHFDHRWATYDGDDVRELTFEEKSNTQFSIQPRYWVSRQDVNYRLADWDKNWLLGFRDITNATNERSLVMSVLSRVAVGNKIPLVLSKQVIKYVACFLANSNSLPFDFIIRQKIAGTTLNFFIFKQFPFLPPSAYTPADIEYIAPRVLELVYTAWDIKAFADDLWKDGGPGTENGGKNLQELFRLQWEQNGAVTGRHEWNPPDWAHIAEDGIPFPPFKWDEARRAQLRAELDAYYARLYGLTRDELRYILDPKDVYGPDFPGETFRVLKEKEIRLYGEYRTRRLVLEAWDALEGNQVMGYTGKQVAELPMMGYQSSESNARVKEEKQEERNALVTTPKPGEENPAQTMLSDFGLYKCGECGKMVMGFEKENHIREAHEGKWIEWKKLK
jgi:hypothetical protein